MVPKWFYGAMIAVTLVQLAALYRLRTSGAHLPDSTETGRICIGGDAVASPECGAENERGYRFCRGCVSELPGGTARAGANGGTRTRRLT